MAKAGMRRPDPEDHKNHGTMRRNTFNDPKNEMKPVPEIQGKAKYGNEKAGPTQDGD